MIAPESRFERSSDFSEVLKNKFGIDLKAAQLQPAIDRLISKGLIIRSHARELSLSPASRSEQFERLQSAEALESSVRHSWFDGLRRHFPSVDPEIAWLVLRSVLRDLFRRHGLQTLALLDSTVLAAAPEERGLRQIVSKACHASSEVTDKNATELALLDFVGGSRTDPKRAAYLAALSDSTVSFLSLSIPPEIAARLRDNLRALDVFLDTNVLFGLLGLAEPELSEAATELVNLIVSNNLPLKLRFHEESELELRRAFDGLSSHLESRLWPPAVSAAAARSTNINTVTRLYHERNAASPISASSFLQPYKHVDVIIRDAGAIPFRDDREYGQQLLDLQHDLVSFLKSRGRERPYETTSHDAKLLLSVLNLRSAARSSLDARAIIVTSDAMLYVFDAERAKGENRQPATLLVRQFLQLLRPFVSTTPDFDRSFAASFAASEFRAVSTSAGRATLRLLELLAMYTGISEETASSMLTNDMLLGGLQSATDRAVMEELVESAIAVENATLQAERDRLAAHLEHAKTEQTAAIETAVADSRAKFEAELAIVSARAAELEREQQKAATDLESRAKALSHVSSQALAAQQSQEAVEMHLKATQQELAETQAALITKSEQQARSKRTVLFVLALLVSIAFISASELFIRGGHFYWLASHPQTYGLRAAVYSSATLALVGLFRRDLRQKVWLTGLLPVLLVMLQLLGGQTTSPLSSPAAPGTLSTPRNPNPPSHLPP